MRSLAHCCHILFVGLRCLFLLPLLSWDFIVYFVVDIKSKRAVTTDVCARYFTLCHSCMILSLWLSVLVWNMVCMWNLSHMYTFRAAQRAKLNKIPTHKARLVPTITTTKNHAVWMQSGTERAKTEHIIHQPIRMCDNHATSINTIGIDVAEYRPFVLLRSSLVRL